MRRLGVVRGGATVVAAATAAALAACAGGERVLAPSASPPPAMAPTARYRVTFDAQWSAATHPQGVPSNPHFSGLIGGTHRAGVRFWESGGLASEGMRLMAEEGRKSPLDQEVQAAIAAGGAQHLLSGGAVASSPGQVDLEFEVSREYPLVTLVTMVAPSPDWFVGVAGLSLVEGDWVAERVVPLPAWDAGTDGGTTFLSPNRPLSPRQPISRIQDGPLVMDGVAPPLGTFTFRRLP